MITPARVLCASWLTLSAAAAPPLRVAAAASLSDVLSEIASAERPALGERPAVEFVFGASGQLATQIRNGAKVDVFISAAPEFADALIRDGLARAESRAVVATNRLTLIAPLNSSRPSSLESLVLPEIRRVALGEPNTVPAGRYAMDALQARGLADQLAGRLIYGKNVRQVLDYVERGEVDAGFVYETDAISVAARIRVVSRDLSVTPIEYVGVALSDRAAGTAYLNGLRSPRAQSTLLRFGFQPPAGAASRPASTP